MVMVRFGSGLGLGLGFGLGSGSGSGRVRFGLGFGLGQKIQARVGAKVEIAMEGSIANVGSLDCNR